jgi:small subunit ribosomal protein S5
MEPRMRSEFEERVIQIRRVSKKNKGGNVISFTTLAVIGNKNGKVGVGYAKAKDVSSAVTKAMGEAKKSVVEINMKGTSIAHSVEDKFGAAKVFLKPAPEGSGVIAGGVIRVVLELAGIKDISSKMLGSSNKIGNVRATLRALGKLKPQVK